MQKSRTGLGKLAQTNDVKLIFKELPILGEQSVVAVRAALASMEPITFEWTEKLAARLHLDLAKVKPIWNLRR